MDKLLLLHFLVLAFLQCVFSSRLIYRDSSYKLKTSTVTGKLLNQYGMISSHDAATGELIEDRDKVVEHWTRTQKGTIIDQLNCGARNLDYRPYLHENGSIYFHHGPIVIYKEMSKSLEEIIAWTKENPSELVTLSVSHCVDKRFKNNYYSDGCHDAVISLLNQYNIPTISDCSELNSLTMEGALGKGNVLAVFGCSFGYWDPSITCTSKDYVCYKSWPLNTTSIPWDKIENFVYQSSSFVPVSDGKLWGFGANWQSSAESVVFGTLHNSSLVLDEERSNLNHWTLMNLKAGKIKYYNLLGMDNLCHYGAEIFEVMQQYNAKLVPVVN